MENKAIQIEPKAAIEMITWNEFDNAIPVQHPFDIPLTNECPTKKEINSIIDGTCNVSSNELVGRSELTFNVREDELLTASPQILSWGYNDIKQRESQLIKQQRTFLNGEHTNTYTFNYTGQFIHTISGDLNTFEILNSGKGILRIRPLKVNNTGNNINTRIKVDVNGVYCIIYLTHKKA